MVIIKTISGLGTHVKNATGYPDATGFVPTMGALHEGHISLIKASKREQGLTIVSIFINPTQFNEPSDFQQYPVTIEADISMLEAAGCDILFLPSVQEVYPDGLIQNGHYELGLLETVLEGWYRPGHFQGVCQVVDRLVSIVKPACMYLGRKDYQQCRVIQKMLDITGKKIQLQIVPTVREESGLAMSSRNMRLTAAEREEAVSVYRQLQMIRNSIHDLTVPELIKKATANLLEDGFSKIDYVAIADPVTLAAVETVTPGVPVVVLIAAFLHGVRLIDNVAITP